MPDLRHVHPADTGVWSSKSLGWIALGVLGVIATILALILGL